MNVKFPIPDFLFQEQLASNYKMSAFSLPPDFIFAFFWAKTQIFNGGTSYKVVWEKHQESKQ